MAALNDGNQSAGSELLVGTHQNSEGKIIHLIIFITDSTLHTIQNIAHNVHMDIYLPSDLWSQRTMRRSWGWSERKTRPGSGYSRAFLGTFYVHL